MLTPGAAAEYWIKALGVSDISGLRGALPRLVVENAQSLRAPEANISAFPRGQDFLSLLFEEEKHSDEVSACLCFCVPGAFVGTDLRAGLVQTKPADEETPVTQRDEVPTGQRERAEGTDIVYIVPLLIARDGSLRPRRNGIPLIVRSHLEPSAGDSSGPVVGDEEAYLRLISEFGSRPDELPMEEYWASAMEMFAAVADKKIFDHRSVFPGFSLMLVPARAGFTTRALAEVYAALADAKPGSTPLMDRLVHPSPSARSSRLSGEDAVASCSNHIAMVDRDKAGQQTLFPLDKTQRLALHNVIALGTSNGIVAVSGPPGTGKTDMLRAVIANQWALAARSKSPWCPVTLVCGATRQSVFNVMEALDGAVRPLERSALKARWIQGLGGYSSTFPSSSRRKLDGKSYQTVELVFHTDDDGRSRSELRLTGRAEAVGSLGASELPKLAAYFLSCLRRAFPEALPMADEPSTIEDARAAMTSAHAFLLEKLERAVDGVGADRSYLERGYTKLEKPALDEWYEALGGSLEDPGWKQAVGTWMKRPDASRREDVRETIEGMLDVGPRWLTFHLSARAWEAFWLIGLPERQTSGALKERGPLRRLQLRRIAMLTPCMVSTLHSAPNVVKNYVNHRNELGWQWLDLLVIDEAGQAAPELGAAVIALASRALVVGDVKQLAPITQMVEPLEEPIARACGADPEALAAGHLDSSTGSVMAMAMRASCCADPGGPGGIRLRNHYRCYPTIINLCIALQYNEKDDVGAELVPKLTDPRRAEWDDVSAGGYPLPPMAFVQGGSPMDEPEGRETKRNPGEARRLVDWIETNGPRLLAWHRRVQGAPDDAPGFGLEKLVKVVTPFRGQMDLIKQQLERFDGECHPDLRSLGKRLTVGTVHTLQGAEAPVILFSAVNKESTACRSSDDPLTKVFVDRDGGKLLNVAVSRAQRSFILFGHSDLFFSPPSLDSENDLPSAITGRYLAGMGSGSGYGVKLGPTSLVVVESIAKAKVIGDILGPECVVIGTNGHFRRFASLDFDEALTPVWSLGESETERDETRSVLRRVGVRLLQTRHLVLATDADREGEAIAWHFLQVIKTHPWWNHIRDVSRVTFDSLTPEVIRSSFANPLRTALLPGEEPEACLDLGQAYSALARGVIDATLGATYRTFFEMSTGRVAASLTRLLAANLEHQPVDDPDKRWVLDVVLRSDEFEGERLATLVRRSGPEAGKPMRFRRRSARIPGGGSAQDVSAKLHARSVKLRTTLPPRLVMVPAPTGMPTASVLAMAWQRNAIPPHRTMKVLQRLYERQVDAAEGAAPRRRVAPSPTYLGIAPLVDGRLVLNKRGAEMAKQLAGPVLAHISDMSFAARVDKGLDDIADDPTRYRHHLAEWVNEVRKVHGGQSVLPEQVSAPMGRFDSETSLWDGFPECRDGSVLWAGPLTDTDGGSAFARTSLREGDTERSGQTENSVVGAAHSSMVPLSLWISPEMLPRNTDPDLLAVYSILWGGQVACVLKPACIRVTTLLFESEGIGSYDLAVHTVEIVEPGYTEAEAGLRSELLQGHLTPDEYVAVMSDAKVHAYVHGDPTHEELPRATPDGILTTMLRRHLGRPSTYGSHIQGLLG